MNPAKTLTLTFIISALLPLALHAHSASIFNTTRLRRFQAEGREKIY